jgi:hypothetical protein
MAGHSIQFAGSAAPRPAANREWGKSGGSGGSGGFRGVLGSRPRGFRGETEVQPLIYALHRQPLVLSRFVENFLWGVPRSDPVSFVTIAAILVATGMVACLVPGTRATRIDPIVALRAD